MVGAAQLLAKVCNTIYVGNVLLTLKPSVNQENISSRVGQAKVRMYHRLRERERERAKKCGKTKHFNKWAEENSE